MVEKISVQIALEGTEQVKRELAGVSEAGQKCFADISAAAAKAGGFDRLDPTLVAQKFSQFGVTAVEDVNKITAALQAAGKTEAMVTGVQKMEQGVRQLGDAATRTTAAFGLTRREIGALGRALRAANFGAVGSQLALIGRVGGAFGGAGIALTAIGVGIAGVTVALAKFAFGASETEKALTQLQATSGQSFENLSAMSIAFAQGGTSTAQFAKEYDGLQQKIAQLTPRIAGDVARTSLTVIDAWGKVLHARQAVFGDVAAGDFQRQARAAAKQQLEVARKELLEAQANDLQTLINKFADLGKGIKQSFDPLTTMDSKVKAVIGVLAQSGASIDQIGNKFSDMGAKGQDAFLRLADIFKNLGSEAERLNLGRALGLSPETIATLSQGSAAIKATAAEAERLGLTLSQSQQQALQQMSQAWNQFTGLFAAFFQKMGAIAAPVFAEITAVFTQAMQGIVQDFSQGWDQGVANLGNRLAPAFTALANVITPIIVQLGTALGNAFAQALGDAAKQALLSVWSSIGQEIQTNVNIFIDNILRALARLGIGPGGKLGSSGAGEIAGGGGSPLAGGGMIGGRGTGTSDSNLAWVSRGEYVVPARAVAQPGVLALLEALRRTGGNLAGVLNGMGRFALGGMVPRPAMAFAGGGMVGSMSHVTIQFPGLPEISGLRASTGTVEELRRAAAMAQVRSGGRKPSRYS